MFENLREQLAEPVVTSTIALIGLIGYILHYVLKRREFTMLMGAKAVIIALGYETICGGLRVGLISFDKRACELLKVDALYFLVSGTITTLLMVAAIFNQHATIKSADLPDSPNA